MSNQTEERQASAHQTADPLYSSSVTTPYHRAPDEDEAPKQVESDIQPIVAGLGKAVGFNITVSSFVPRKRLHPIYGSFPKVTSGAQTTPPKPPLLAQVEDSVWQGFWKSVINQMNAKGRFNIIILILGSFAAVTTFLPHEDGDWLVFAPAIVVAAVVLAAVCFFNTFETSVKEFQSSFEKHGVHVEIVKYKDGYGRYAAHSEYILFTDRVGGPMS